MTDTVVVRVKPGSRKVPLVEVGSTGDLTITCASRRSTAGPTKRSPAYWRPTSNCQEAKLNWYLELVLFLSRQKCFRVSR
jgi:hypothetical protein